MSIRERIDKDLIQAIRDKDEVVKDTLRMLKTEFVTHGSDDEIAVLARAIKSREQAAESYREGEREDLALREEQEINVVRRYMPKPLSEAEVGVVVKAVIEELGLTSKRDMGKAMKVLKERYRGQVDGKALSTLVAKHLE